MTRDQGKYYLLYMIVPLKAEGVVGNSSESSIILSIICSYIAFEFTITPLNSLNTFSEGIMLVDYDDLYDRRH